VFQHIQRVGPIEVTCHRPLKNVVLQALKLPLRIFPLTNVFDEDWIEIDGCQASYMLQNDPGSKGIRTSNLQHLLTPGEHPGNEFVSREME
jgi:hypothetical protein